MRALLLVFIILSYSSNCFAYGALASGYRNGSIDFTSSYDKSSSAEAEAAALQDCRLRGLKDCGIAQTFSNQCIAAVTSFGNVSDVGIAPAVDQARRSAFTSCQTNHRSACTERIVRCDTIEPVASSEPPNPFVRAMAAAFPPEFWKALQLFGGATAIALWISGVLVLWVLISAISATPPATVRWRAVLSAWIIVPLIPAVVSWFFEVPFGISKSDLYLGTSLWTDVFAALAIGIGCKRVFVKQLNSPNLLSLPVTTFVFTVISYGVARAVVRFGTFEEPTQCIGDPHPAFSVCGYFQNEGSYALATILIVMIICGAVLPKNSNLIRANDWMAGRIRKPSRLHQQTRPLSQSNDALQEPKPQNTNQRPDIEPVRDAHRVAIKSAVRTRRDEFDL
jgi:hypothetical protein